MKGISTSSDTNVINVAMSRIDSGRDLVHEKLNNAMQFQKTQHEQKLRFQTWKLLTKKEMKNITLTNEEIAYLEELREEFVPKRF